MYLSVYLLVCLPIYLSTYLFICLSVSLFINLPTYLFFYIFIYLPVYLFTYLSVYLPIYQKICSYDEFIDLWFLIKHSKGKFALAMPLIFQMFVMLSTITNRRKRSFREREIYKDEKMNMKNKVQTDKIFLYLNRSIPKRRNH